MGWATQSVREEPFTLAHDTGWVYVNTRATSFTMIAVAGNEENIWGTPIWSAGVLRVATLPIKSCQSVGL